MEYGREIRIDQKHLEKKLDIANIADYNSSEFKENGMGNTR